MNKAIRRMWLMVLAGIVMVLLLTLTYVVVLRGRCPPGQPLEQPDPLRAVSARTGARSWWTARRSPVRLVEPRLRAPARRHGLPDVLQPHRLLRWSTRHGAWSSAMGDEPPGLRRPVLRPRGLPSRATSPKARPWS
ncbi:hypothetical protein QJS66_11665 [Kocuria rhizophila]|nr:hypothetical protein QJS66_11665 [Kocuria rhizophila]